MAVEGYCAHCHEVRGLSEGTLCPVCGAPLMDLRETDRLRTAGGSVRPPPGPLPPPPAPQAYVPPPVPLYVPPPASIYVPPVGPRRARRLVVALVVVAIGVIIIGLVGARGP